MPVGAGAGAGVEWPLRLGRFFESIARLEAGQAQGDVRIVQFGDSHTAADIETAATRRTLQDRFGDGGRGFVAIGKPFSGYRQEGVRSGMSSQWSAERGVFAKGKFKGDGLYGLAGISVEAKHYAARAWTDIHARTSRAELAYLEQPHGGSFDVFIDNACVGRIATRGVRASSAFRAFEMSEGGAHQIGIRASGDGEVRMFGVSLERSQHGIVLDALGINGARAATCLQWNEAHWSEQLTHRAPALVVLAYGTNESADPRTTPQVYEQRLVDLLGRMARAVPAASCLLLGPPDRATTNDGRSWTTSPKLLEIIASQRRVAEAAGCSFYDQFAAMGGVGTVARWAEEDPPRASKDRVHFARDSYAQLGTTFAASLITAYLAWRHDAGMKVQR